MPIRRAMRPGARVRSALLRAALAAAAPAGAQAPTDVPNAGPAAPGAWLAGTRPTAAARAALAALRGADARGLRPADYDAESLGAQAAALPGGAGDAAAAARFDAALTRALGRLLTHLHRGRADPAALGLHLPDAHAGLDVAALVGAVSRAPDSAAAAAVVAAAEPPYAGYAALGRALARYRALSADATMRPAAAPARPLRPGDTYADASALRRLLGAYGDLPAGPGPAGTRSDDTSPDAASPDAAPPNSADTVYTAALAGGVRAFQARHGLAPDGVFGGATVAALRVPPAVRARQIALALERWRWLPDTAPARYAVVNVPAFRVYLFEADAAAARPAFRTNVIVGAAYGGRRTPVFAATLREVVFRPYWDVPPSIARNELLPAIRRRPAYLDREHLEIVRGGDEGARVYPATAGTLARVAAGALRLRQRPGPGNALGLVKLVFPNPYNVYLHGTPAQALFARGRRDFSHGCIRVEEPAALAAAVLAGQPGWDRAAVDAAMHGDRTRRVRVARPVRVFVLYATAVVGDDGLVRFYPDVYGHDAALAGALGR